MKPGDLAESDQPLGGHRRRPGIAFQNVADQDIVQMAAQALAPAGGSLPHNNMQPYLTLNFCIALQGVFPARP